ncbi:hypothetical protein CL689_04370 [Candidatus Saccharibacteria bacterium]|mgnify:FL=1|nr:hypothetical protein [Candidatus Saccharibacteria bacterium]MBJ58406.1 hypothetical protein [Candidatus Saccharibacteria bacterium]MBQ69278.1 hypothetical protein [Candidatus Saccharibacteria bacterium]|tara:strand:- start:2070 stop:3647 length:1578 start_codon:yes stop_codon:yes gene_type:complete
MKQILHRGAAWVKAHPKIDIAVLVAGLFIFALVTLFHVSSASIWFDEAFSAYIIRFDYWQIAAFTSTDVHPPFYYWALKLWSDLFGTTELALRSLSIVFAIGAISGAFILMRRLFGRSVAAVSLLFMVLSPMIVRYSDEARMYTLATLIVVWATYVLVRAIQAKNQKRWWVAYAVLVALGMWTHYFTAFVWLAHWAWRGIVVAQKNKGVKAFAKAYFTKSWLWVHVLAVGLFVPWLFFMVKQLGTVQGSGFWIGPVGVDTPVNYLTNIFYYLEHGKTQSWIALLIVTVIALVIILIPKTYRRLRADSRQSFWLVSVVAFVPPILLFLSSLPPLRPSFVDRYLIPSILFYSLFMAVVFVVGTRSWRPIARVLPIILVSGMMIFGISNVYYYGNYNKNSNTHILTRQVINEIKRVGGEGQPIVANSPWLLYEAAPYESADHPVYFIDENTQYIFGSLDMLKESDLHKISDLDAFEKANPVIWYFGATTDADVTPYRDDWRKIQTVSVTSPITGKTVYRATAYQVSAE